MSHVDCLWEAPALTFDQIPTLQDALACCDDRLLIRESSRLLAERRSLEEGREHDGEGLFDAGSGGVADRLAELLRGMRSLPVAHSPHARTVLLPQEHFVLYALSDGCYVKRSLRFASLSFNREEGWSPKARIEEDPAPDRLYGIGASRRLSLELVPWRDALALKVWLAGRWCCHERYAVLAKAFCELVLREMPGAEDDRASDGEGVREGKPAQGACPGLYPFGMVGSVPARPVDVMLADRAVALGLHIPDAVEEEYREKLVSRAADLNEAAGEDVLQRARDLAARLRAA